MKTLKINPISICKDKMNSTARAVVVALFVTVLSGVHGYVSRVCEHATMSLSCNGKISISWANYGKLSYSYCNHGGNANCRASSSMSVLRSRCDGKSSCSVQASNGIFGDPCGGTFKYLEVHWSCLTVQNGGWSSWGGWGSCTRNCGSGTKSRSRSCNNPAPANGGAYCSGSSSSSTSCNTHSCPVHGNWGSWGSYGSCTKSCGSGTRTRSRSCNNPAPAHGGNQCSGSSTSSTSCNTHSCPIHGNWGSWGSYGSCTVTCAGGTKTRPRSCNNPAPAHGGNQCSGSSTSSTSCNTHNCPIDGNWGSWGNYGSCTVTCAGGTKTRSRSCDSPAPQYGGSSCSGSLTSSTSCNTHHCPIDGVWASWGSWGTCTVTCGGGTQDRSRTCTNPAPQYGGAACPGSGSSRQDCNTHHCPIDGVWAAWGSWGTCTLTCGGGTQDRSRTCTNPSPQYGGAQCPGSAGSTQDCNTHNCPIDGAWTSWTAWGTCTVTCGGGTQVKTRSCTNPQPQYGGANCAGVNSASQDCNTQVCIIDGAWGAWSSWGTCTKTCDSGTYSRTRICDDPPPANGGLPCPGDSSDFGTCNAQSCPTVAPGTYQQLCPTGWFSCQSGQITCIQDSLKCDCQADCDDDSDESDTYASCPADHLEQCMLKAAAGNLHPLGLTVLLTVVVMVLGFIRL